MTRKDIDLFALKSNFTASCDCYIKAFEQKHGYEFDGWVANEVGGIASFIDQYFFNLLDIVYDIDSKQPKGRIFEWQDACVNHAHTTDSPKFINYRSWCMGLRFDTAFECGKCKRLHTRCECDQDKQLKNE